MCIFAAMNENILPIHFAPLQGYTDAVYRRAHARIFGGIETYYSPFVRMEHGEIRRKDARDIGPENNPGLHLMPPAHCSGYGQAGAHNVPFSSKKGYREADINLGCPFPMLARRHNGSGMLPYPEEVKALLSEAIDRHPDIRFLREAASGFGSRPEECLAPAAAVQRASPRTHHPAPTSGQAAIQRGGRPGGIRGFLQGVHPSSVLQRRPAYRGRYPFHRHTVPPIGRYRPSAVGCSPILPWRWNTSKEPRFLPMKWRKSGTTAHRSVQQLPGATARRRHATADENEKLLGIPAAGRRPQGAKDHTQDHEAGKL